MLITNDKNCVALRCIELVEIKVDLKIDESKKIIDKMMEAK